MRTSWILPALLTTVTLALPGVLTAQAARSTPRIPRPDFSEARRIISKGMAKDSLAGLAVAVTRGDSILWEEGFGWANLETRVPATANTPFYLASVTKTITATAAMLLRERGQLDLDRSANSYLGTSRLWSPVWDPAGATPRMLATHTSGLTTFDMDCSPEVPRCHLPSFDETIRRYGVLVWQRGARFDYSNLGYRVLGEVVAKAAGQDLGTFLREQVFRPLGMSHASLDIDPAVEGETSIQYAWIRGPLPRGTPLASGASSVYASAHDLALFGELHAKAHRAGKRALLADASIDTMQYSLVPTGQGSRSRYGIGWWVENEFGYRTVLAQGGTVSSSTWLRVVPSEGIAVVVLANKGVGFPSDVIDAILAALLPPFAERRAAQKTAAVASNPVSPTVATPPDTALVGTWSGIVRTVDSDLGLRLVVSDSGTVLGTVGSGTRAALDRVRLVDTLLRFSLAGDLAADTTEGRRLAFYLRLRQRDQTLYGAVTTRPPASSGLDGRVSYWVELNKQR